MNNMNNLIYISGLSGSGKTTIAKALQKIIPNSILLDGDEIRSSINSDLGFEQSAKIENIRRNNALIKLLYDQGFTVICAFMASIASERDKLFNLIPAIKVQIEIPLEVCKKRDTKGLYDLCPDDFAGVTSIYTPLPDPKLVINTDILSVNECVSLILQKIN